MTSASACASGQGAYIRPAGAHISAATLSSTAPSPRLAARLHAHGIIPTFGLRYPGGGSQNLLQAFTPRHAASPLASLQRLAVLSERGLIDALQLEMSVAVRLAGALRQRNLDTLSAIFRPAASSRSSSRAASRACADPRGSLRAATTTSERQSQDRRRVTHAARPCRSRVL